MSDYSALKVLIADDADSDRRILESIIREQGHTVFSVRDGSEAVEQFQVERPHIVLLDALMPRLDGFGAARQMKALAGENFIPIIFLTSLTDTDALAACLDAGGDDFLQKPYNRVILQAKIKAVNRMRELHATMLLQRNQIIQQNIQLIQEQTVAKQLFDNIAHSGCLDASNVKYHLTPRAVFNGDVLVAALRPSGSMMLLLGDFTGHGLPAAIGAMPLASAFYGMVHKGFSLTDVLREINGKLKSILPIGVFCCATFMEFNFRDRSMTVWNGGLPDCFIYRHKYGEIEAIKSHHLPLGVLPSPQLKVDCQHFALDVGDRCYLWSDGIHEARNKHGEMFGEERLRSVFRTSRHASQIFDDIMASVHDFTGEATVDDDLSLVEITMVAPEQVISESMPHFPANSRGLMEWSLEFEVKPSSFRYFDPLPLLLGVITEVPGLRGHGGTLYTVLSELYSNALEHGVLRLDSGLKRAHDGFSRYYELRTRRLEKVAEGYVRFYLSHSSQEEGGCLVIRVEDSGDGFNHNVICEGNDATEYSGRGIPLVREFCQSLSYRGKGNLAEAVYKWSNGRPNEG